jgi:hypothetical protein
MRWKRIGYGLAMWLAVGGQAVAQLPGDHEPDRQRDSRRDALEAREGLDMSAWARQLPKRRGPAMVYLNFDGWYDQDGKGHLVVPFSATTGNRERDIQDILYRTAQSFAPFNIRLARLKGNGNHDRSSQGNTTVFIGANTLDIEKKGRKYPHAWARGVLCDFPPAERGSRPQGHPYHLAFMDNVGQRKGSEEWTNNWNDNTHIARSIAHEAGHTFGLAHILSNGFPELMSYDAPNKSYFANRTFPTTDLNFNAEKGVKEHTKSGLMKWHGVPMVRENAFNYLMTRFGPRPPDDHPDVADRRSVDPGFEPGTEQDLVPDTPAKGAIAPLGDYDVFHVPAGPARRIELEVQPGEDRSLQPVFLVYDAAGIKMKAFARAREPGSPCRAQWQAKAGESYHMVVGAVDSATVGAYEVVTRHAAATPLADAPAR